MFMDQPLPPPKPALVAKAPPAPKAADLCPGGVCPPQGFVNPATCPCFGGCVCTPQVNCGSPFCFMGGYPPKAMPAQVVTVRAAERLTVRSVLEPFRLYRPGIVFGRRFR